jgi:hypothetical protein
MLPYVIKILFFIIKILLFFFLPVFSLSLSLIIVLLQTIRLHRRKQPRKPVQGLSHPPTHRELETHFQSHGTPSLIVLLQTTSLSPFSHPGLENPRKSQPSNVVEEEEGEGAEDDDSVSNQSELESKSRFKTTRSLIRRTGMLPRSGFSRGFDLSRLFEEGGEEVRFVLGEPVSKIGEEVPSFSREK